MRKLALLAMICVAAVTATGAGAAAPEHLTIPIRDTFYAPFMSDACGIPVTITIDGIARVTLWRNDAGLVVAERDSTSSFTAVFESPLDLGGTGLSFTNRSPNLATFDYGSGATIGSTAQIALYGSLGPAAGPGSAMTAGLQRLSGTVVAFSPEGVPIVDFDGPVQIQRGNWPGFDLVLAERCAALGGSVQP